MFRFLFVMIRRSCFRRSTPEHIPRRDEKRRLQLPIECYRRPRRCWRFHGFHIALVSRLQCPSIVSIVDLSTAVGAFHYRMRYRWRQPTRIIQKYTTGKRGDTKYSGCCSPYGRALAGMWSYVATTTPAVQNRRAGDEPKKKKKIETSLLTDDPPVSFDY